MFVHCSEPKNVGVKKSDGQLKLAVLQQLTGERRVSSYSSIVYQDVHSSQVVLDPLEGSQHFGLVTDVTLHRVQFTGR
jgi:hypothetical protein